MRKILAAFLFLFSAAVQAAPLCDKPELYCIAADKSRASKPEAYCLDAAAARANPGAYCWELKYMGEEEKTSVEYVQPLPIANTELLRKKGITPEKAAWLAEHFTDENYDGDEEVSEGRPDDRKLEIIMARAKKSTRALAEYKINDSSWGYIKAFDDPDDEARKDDEPDKKEEFICMEDIKWPGRRDKNQLKPGPEDSPFRGYPEYLRPVGVVGTDFVNAFGEVVGRIHDDEGKRTWVFFHDMSKNPVRLLDNRKIGTWNAKICGITDIESQIKFTGLLDRKDKALGNKYACTPCAIFEIAFDTVSRIAFVMYDKISAAAIGLLGGGFLIWLLFVAYETIIKKGDGYGFFEQLFSRFGVVLAAIAFMEVSIKSEHNIFNYTIHPITRFMNGFVRYSTSAMPTTTGAGIKQECHYASMQEAKQRAVAEGRSAPEESKGVLFPPEVRNDIVCSIERVADFVHLNFLIGQLQLSAGWREFWAGDAGSASAKMFLGLGVMAIFFILNLLVPYYFIESIFMIGVITIILPLLIAAYALERTRPVAKKALNILMSAVFQIISLSLVLSVIAMLFAFVGGADVGNLKAAVEKGVPSALLLYLYSFSASSLLEIFYTGVLGWYLVGKAVKLANNFGEEGDVNNLPMKFLDFQRSIAHTFASAKKEKLLLGNTAEALARRARGEKGE